MEKLFLEILSEIGEDVSRAGLLKTPARAAAAFQSMTAGYNLDPLEIGRSALFPSESEDMVLVQGVEFYSLCEHHLLPFFGHCHVSYIPSGKIVGLSKIPRIVDALSRRLQVQEGLTRQIAETILHVTEAKGVAVLMEARHMCMMMRGVEKQGSSMKTSSLLGLLKECEKTRDEFFHLLQAK